MAAAGSRGEHDPRWPAVVHTARRFLDQPADTGEVVRSGTALLVRFGRVLIRAWDPARLASAEREVTVARILSAAGVPAVRLVDRIDQPVVHREAVVTVWHWIDVLPGEVGATGVGALAGALRRATGGIGGVPPFEPLAVVRSLIATTAVHRDDHRRDVDDLVDMVADVESGWRTVAVADPAGTGVVHGDLHRLNVLPTARGPVLADLEVAGLGPPSYDTAPAVVGVRRYGADPQELEEFIAASGHDPRPWPGFHVCCRVYELWVTAWTMAGRTASVALDREAALRMECLRGNDDRTWHLY